MSTGGVATERHRVRIGPTSISYEVAGAGPPVVLVHGLSGSSRWWGRNVGPLARRFRVHVVDLIGFGASRGRQRFVLDRAAGCLAAWMDRLGLDRAAIAGHSMGGYIAADLAADFPDRVERLVLIAAAAGPFRTGRLRSVVGLARALRHLPPSFVPMLVADAARCGPVTILRAARELYASDITDKLVRITAPTLVVWGARDAAVPLELGRQLCRAIPGAEMVVIERAGHTPMWDRPDEFNRLMIDFLSASPSAPSASA
jgi:pimeloyl-ACP methyl ester carboxylesterase